MTTLSLDNPIGQVPNPWGSNVGPAEPQSAAADAETELQGRPAGLAGVAGEDVNLKACGSMTRTP